MNSVRDCIRKTTCVGLVALSIGLTSAPAYAQQRTYHIPATSLSDALREFGRVSGRQIIFTEVLVRGKRAPALSGNFTPEEALSRLLRDSGLKAERTPAGALMIVPATESISAEAAQQGRRAESAAAGFEDAESADLIDQEIVVTGSHIRGSAPAGANLTALDRQDLINTGRQTLAEAIQTIPQVHGGGANAATFRTGVGGAPNNFGIGAANPGAESINLRGLGVEETLILVNGRRMPPAGANGAFSDISILPLAAVERVEILADGASATYGADAMAGVVNIIMNRRFDGSETRLRSGIETRSGEPEWQASQTFGRSFNRGNILISGSWLHRDAITTRGRPFASSSDLRRFGGGDYRTDRCSPGNILAPLSLSGAIPPNQNGEALTPDQIIVGQTNLCEPNPISSHVTPRVDTGSIYVAGSYDLSERFRLSADVIASMQGSTTVGAYHSADLVIPTSNAFRQMNGFHGDLPPLNGPITVAYRFDEVPPSTTNTEALSVLGTLGADYELGRGWQVSAAGTFATYESKSEDLRLDNFRPATQGGALERALASSDPTSAFNPFGAGSSNSRSLVESLFYTNQYFQQGNYHSATLSLTGPLFELPAGALKLAVGGDYRKERFEDRTRQHYGIVASGFQQLPVNSASRRVSAIYGELFVPLFSKLNEVPGARRLSLSVSGRYDHYSDFGGTFNPKMGATWEPIRGLTIKGTYGSSFKAPLLKSVSTDSNALFRPFPWQGGSPDINDDGFVRTILLTGGNTSLEPEKAKSWTAGVEARPAALPGLHVHATYFNLRFKGRFAQISSVPLVFSDPAAYDGIAFFPLPSSDMIEKVLASVDHVRGAVPPAGSVEAIIDNRVLNFASQVMDGVDAGANFRAEVSGGKLNFSASVSYITRYKSRLGQSVAVTSYVGNVGLPTRWKARGGVSWSGGIATLSGWLNHSAGYVNKLVTPHERVNSYTTADISAVVDIGKWMTSSSKIKSSLGIFITNALDRSPPFVNSPLGGYDGANADPVGRRVSLQFIQSW